MDAYFHCAASFKTGIDEQLLKRVRDTAHLNTSEAVSCLLSPPRLSAPVLICAAPAELHMGVVAAFGIVVLVSVSRAGNEEMLVVAVRRCVMICTKIDQLLIGESDFRCVEH